MGKRFGFARAVNVKEPERFVMKLDNIIIGREKIMVNLPRFQRKQVEHSKPINPKPIPVNRENVQSTKPQPKPTDPKNHNPQSHPNPIAPKTHRHQPQKLTEIIQKKWIPKNQKPKPKPALPNFPETEANPSQIKNFKPPPKPRRVWAHRHFTVDEEDINKYSNAYVGVVRKSGMSYNIQEDFIQQRYFSVRATPMGSNLVLLESLEEGEMEALIEDANDWLGHWFEDIRKWSPGEIDNERLTWVRCYGVPVHAWSSEFFEYIVAGTGYYINVDENTEKRKTMDVARILIRSKVHDIINFVEKIDINGEMFVIKVVEDLYGPLQWCKRSETKMKNSLSSGSSDSEDDGESNASISDDESGEDSEAASDNSGEFVDEEEEETQHGNPLVSNHYVQQNSIGLEERESAHHREKGGTCSIFKENQMMVNVEISANSNKGEMEKPHDGKSNGMRVIVGGGSTEKNVENCPSYNLPCPLSNSERDISKPSPSPSLNQTPPLSVNQSPVSPRPSLLTQPNPPLASPLQVHSSGPILSPSSSDSIYSPSPITDDPISPTEISNIVISSIPLVVELPPIQEHSNLPIVSQGIETIQDASSIKTRHEGEFSNSNLEVANSNSHWGDQSLSKEEKIWLLAQKMGVYGNNLDQLHIERIGKMEARDKEARKKMVNQNSPK